MIVTDVEDSPTARVNYRWVRRVMMVEASTRPISTECSPIRCVLTLGGRHGTTASEVPLAVVPTTTRTAPSVEGSSDGQVSLPSRGGQNLCEFDDRCTAVKDHLLASVSRLELRLSPQHPPRKAHRPPGKHGLQSVQIG